MGRSYTFTHALSRAPAASIVDGLRAVDTGTPDLDVFRAHHASYVEALRSTGADVQVLDALEQYPDSVFIEDAALCLPDMAIAMRPGAPSRFGEGEAIQPTLSRRYGEVVTMDGPGFIEGGDILVTEREILVGRSARTDEAGVAELRRIVEARGWVLREVHTPPGVLHFKTDCSLLDEETILCTDRLAASGCFDRYRLILTAKGEEACANAIRFNELVVFPAGFPRTHERLTEAGYKVHEIGNTEAAKLDGGMSCLSLRFTPLAG